MKNFLGLFFVIFAVLLRPVPAFSFDHTYGLWDGFLKKHVKAGLVDYEAVKKAPQDFETVVQKIEGITPEEYKGWPAKEKMAFWINAYNIGAIKLVLEHYPLRRTFGLQALRYPAESIQQIPDAWQRKAFNIMGKEVSLNYIENDVLRGEFKDPRVHFSIVCASRSCPVLKEEAYVPEKIEKQLNEQVHFFLSDPNKFRYEAKSDTLYLSPIFKWFQGDFERAGGIASFIKKYIPPELGSKITNQSKKTWLDYDWSLNKQ